MKRKKPPKNVKEPQDNYKPVFNEQGERVRGLWQRFGRFYAQLDASNGRQYRYRLESAKTIPQAILAKQALKNKQQSGILLPPTEHQQAEQKAELATKGSAQAASGKEGREGKKGHGGFPPERMLQNAVVGYQADRDNLKKKAAGTCKRENSSFKFWCKLFGSWDLLKIGNQQVSQFAIGRGEPCEAMAGGVPTPHFCFRHGRCALGRRIQYCNLSVGFRTMKLNMNQTIKDKLTPRERIMTACAHREPDRLPVDFGGGFQTGIHVSMVYKLRQALGLDQPGTPVKVVEVSQMLGEMKPDLQDALGIDTVGLHGMGTSFGFPQLEFKEWRLTDGTPVLVPKDFNTQYEPDGELLQWPGNDRSVPPSARMPAGGHFFDAIMRQEPFDEASLNPADNQEEFQPVLNAELDYYRTLAEQLYTHTNRAVFCSFRGLTFGDIALVPAMFMKKPRGIRDITEWYMSIATRPDYIKSIFEYQTEVAIENLRRLHEVIGDRATVIQTNGTDFGTQNGPFCSEATYRYLYLPYQKRVNGWIHGHTKWKTFMHCCGGIEPLLNAVIEAEFDILNPVQCSAKGMDARTLKKNYGSQLVFWGGGVDTQQTLPFGTPQQVRDQVSERIEVLAPGGGFVFSTIHNVQANTPIENLLAMFEVIREYR